MDISDLTYAMDKLNLYRAGQLGQLQSPQAMELYRQMYGAATSKPVQQFAETQLSPYSRVIMSPKYNIPLMIGSFLNEAAYYQPKNQEAVQEMQAKGGFVPTKGIGYYKP